MAWKYETPSKPRVGGERRKSRLSPDAHELSCAGQGCPNAVNCVRYRRYPAPVAQKWASFDIERMQDKRGECPAFEQVINPREKPA